MFRRRQREGRNDLLRHSENGTQKRLWHKREKVVGLVVLNIKKSVKRMEEIESGIELWKFVIAKPGDTVSFCDLDDLGSDPRILILFF